MRAIVDLENHQIVYGTGGATQLSGLLSAVGILTLAATGTVATPPNNFDDIAGGIAKLRTGPALANPDLLLLHPNTWANIRTQKDTLGRYISGDDPTDSAVETAWGVEVVQSTQFTAGEAVLLDSTLFGRVAVRESLVLRVGFSGDDFTNNIVRSVCEERLNVAVERPAAICHITWAGEPRRRPRPRRRRRPRNETCAAGSNRSGPRRPRPARIPPDDRHARQDGRQVSDAICRDRQHVPVSRLASPKHRRALAPVEEELGDRRCAVPISSGITRFGRGGSRSHGRGTIRIGLSAVGFRRSPAADRPATTSLRTRTSGARAEPETRAG